MTVASGRPLDPSFPRDVNLEKRLVKFVRYHHSPWTLAWLQATVEVLQDPPRCLGRLSPRRLFVR